jgi:hypothetical protein
MRNAPSAYFRWLPTVFNRSSIEGVGAIKEILKSIFLSFCQAASAKSSFNLNCGSFQCGVTASKLFVKGDNLDADGTCEI